MNTNVWKKAKRIIAFVLAALLINNSAPELMLLVKASANDITDTSEYQIVVGGEDVSGSDSLGMSYEWTPNGVEPEVQVSVSGGDSWNPLTNDDYEVSYADNANVGDASVTVAGKGNYTGSKTVKYTIVPGSLTGAGISFRDGDVYKYTGEEIKPDVTVTYAGYTLDGNYTVSYGDNVAVGSATVTVTGKDNLKDSITKEFYIRKDIADTTVAPVEGQEFTYNGEAQKLAVEVKDGQNVLVEGTDYELSYANNINAGEETATVTVTGKGNYMGTKVLKYTINPFDISGLELELVPDSEEYGKAVPDLKVMNGEEEITVDISYDEEAIKNVGTHDITVSGSDNYTGGQTLEFEVKKVELNTDMITVGDVKAMQVPPVTVSKNGVTFEKDVDYKVEFNPNAITWPGEYTVQIIALDGGRLTGNAVEKKFNVTAEDLSSVDNILGIENAKKVEDKKFYYRDKDAVYLYVSNNMYQITGHNMIQVGNENKYKLKDAEWNDPSSYIVEINFGRNVDWIPEPEFWYVALEFNQDAEKPIVNFNPNYTNPYSNDEDDTTIEWASAMNPVLTATDAKSGVEKVLISTNENFSNAATYTVGNNGKVEWNPTPGKSYYIKAIDYVGNESDVLPVTIAQLDTDAPIFTVKATVNGEEVTIENDSTIYIDEADLDEQGVISFVVWVSDGDGAQYPETEWDDIVKTFSPNADADFADIVNEVVDNVKNAGTHSFKVVYDNGAPVIDALGATSNHSVYGKVDAIEKDGNLVIASDEAVTINVTLTDAVIDGEEQLDKVYLVQGANLADPTIISKTYNDVERTYIYKYSWTIAKIDEGYLNNIYNVVAIDKTGNMVTSQNIYVEIDDANPQFEITFSDYTNHFANNDTLYYGTDVNVTFSIEDDTAKLVGTNLDGFVLKVNDEVVDPNWVRDAQKNNKFKGSLSLTADGEYDITITYEDALGNPITQVNKDANSAKYGEVSGATYTSKHIVRDTVAPNATVHYEVGGVEVSADAIKNGRKYFNEEVTMVFTVTDDNVYYKDVLDVLLGQMKATDVYGNDITATAAKTMLEAINKDTVDNDGFVWEIPLTTQANYTFEIAVKDLVLHNSESWTEEVTVDKTAPEDIKVSYVADSDAKLEGNFDSTQDKWFAKNDIDVTLRVKDSIAGISYITYDYAEEGEAQRKTGTLYTEESTLKSDGYYTYTFKLENVENGFVADNLTISIYENATNNMLDVVGSTVLVMDNVAPVLDVTFDSDYVEGVDNDDKKIFYYVQSEGETGETVELTYTEAFYNQLVDGDSAKKPELVVEDKNGNATNAVITWGEFENDQIKATITLPYGDAAEKEYIIKTTYADGSGNGLVMDTTDIFGSFENNTYISGIIVLDNKAPELTSYVVDGEWDRHNQDGVIVYQHQEEEDKQDIVIAFEIDDNVQYWNAETVKFVLYDDVNGGTVEIDEVTWSNTNPHIGTLKFSGCNLDPSTYHVELYYVDRAGNLMVTNDVTDGALTAGNYVSEKFVLDHKNPIFDISFNEAAKLVKNEGVYEDDEAGYPKTGFTAYYGAEEGKIVVDFSIDEHYANYREEDGVFAGMGVNDDFDFKITNCGTDVTAEYVSDIVWTAVDNDGVDANVDGYTYKGELVIEDEGEFVITIGYRDTANNLMEDGTEVLGKSADSSDGIYVSETLVLDKTAPVLTAVYNKEHVNTNGETGRIYYNVNDVVYTISVEDKHARYHELKAVLAGMKAEYVEGYAEDPTIDISSIITTYVTSKNDDDNLPEDFKMDIPLSIEGNYTIPIAYQDLAGNKAVLVFVEGENEVTMTEYEEPVNELVTVDTAAPVMGLDTKLVVDGSVITNIFDYNNLIYAFAKGNIRYTATVNDNVSGINKVTFSFSGDENREDTVYEVQPVANGTYYIDVPLSQVNFKGKVSVLAEDWSTNSSSGENGMVVEKPGSAENADSRVNISAPSPSRIVDGVAFYNTNVPLNIDYWDGYAGIRNYAYSVNGEGDSFDIPTGAGNNIDLDASVGITLDLNQNDIRVTAGLTDNVGYTTGTERIFNIDKTVPVINVTYDLNEPANEVYYNATRTAVVEITERNFDVRDVEFTITNTDGVMPVISGWSSQGSGDGTVHRATVTFAEDGDYTFTVAFMDKAGNKAAYNRVDTFTIDKTLPTYTITYDNNNSLNGNYFAAGRTATIEVVEHNFNADLVDVIVTAERTEAGVPTISGWTKSGDVYRTTVNFGADADYSLDIQGVDMALNPMADYAKDVFIVDTVAPTVKIFDIVNLSANNGIVRPGIRYSDINYDADSTVIKMVGYNNGSTNMEGEKTESQDGVEIKLHDFPHNPEVDDIYTMDATVYDLAGNSSSAKVVFSVNRFGSVYTFDDDATKNLIGEEGSYYTMSAPDLKITETNVDTLEFKEITCNYNGKITTLVEGQDYTLEQSGSDTSWKQYKYTLSKDNFKEDGTYIVTIYSKDRATNNSDNNSKGKKIEFVVDTKSPSVVFSGIEDSKQYRESEKMVTIDVQDNVRLATVEVKVNGETTTYTAAQVEEMDGKIQVKLDGANSWQTMQVMAYDAAGNELNSDEMRFLITKNLFVQFFMNKKLLIGAIAAVVAAGGGFGFFFAKKRKKEK